MRCAALLLAVPLLLSGAGCAAKNASASHANDVHSATAVAFDPAAEATYAVAGSSRARGAARYRLANPRTHASSLELIVADGSGRSYVDAIAAGTHDVAIVRDGVVLRALGTAGAAEERAFLKAMRSPAPVRPLRPVVSFTAALLSEHQADEATHGKPASVYKLFGMGHGGDDLELYLTVADDGSSVTFSEKDPENRPLLTRFLSR